ncbi:Lrp/AsnC family transcriptional regulator [Leucobacter insecticola]|uniref:Lrp/AsnC family transcriptional regulator n=1 Tax=Leucobacter insecticola TaxID=2714934 RepID=A0A6G8FGC4_9MICO|nr:Lrp/AsnC family transcriptional regulator [Leucobacter insecticola]
MLDDEDLQLVHALQLAPRASWASLAPILGVHSTTLAARWSRLTSAGIAWVVAHPVGSRLSPLTAFIEVLCETTKRDEVVDALSEIPDVVSLDVSARNRDLLLTVSAASMAHFTEDILPAIAEVSGVEHLSTSFSTRMHTIADSWMIRALSPEQAKLVSQLNDRAVPGKAASRVNTDILRELSTDGRLSASEIARKLGMSEPTVRRQLRSAISQGFVSFRCELSQDVSGTPITAEWFATVPASEHLAFARHVAQIPGLRLCASTTGRTNFLLTFWLRSVSEVPHIEALLAGAIPTVEFRESAIALRIVKRLGWLLGEGGRATGRVIAPSWGASTL